MRKVEWPSKRFDTLTLVGFIVGLLLCLMGLGLAR
jgi:hypothetical protein